MILWIVSTALTSIVVVLVCTPFIVRFAVQSSAKAMQAKAGTDPNQGVESGGSLAAIAKDQAQSAPVEISPSPGTHARAREPAANRLSGSGLAWPAVAALGIVVCGSLGLYALMRDRPVQEDPTLMSLLSPVLPLGSALRSNLRAFPKPGSPAARLLEPVATTGSSDQAAPKANSGLAPVDELIERLVARLRQNPKDIGGWRNLGWSYFNLKRFDEAAAAYAKVIELNPNVAEFHSARGEALVRAANGTVTKEAQLAFTNALQLDSKDVRARFFNGLAKVQSGDKTAALDIWIELANEVGTNETPIPELGQQVAALAKELNVDVTRRLEQPRGAVTAMAPEQSKPSSGEPKPDLANTPAAPEDQSAMIRGMVERLAARLEKSPRDVEGWIRLIRSRQVLNEPEAARQSLEHALKVFDDPSPERDHLVNAAKDLGLSP